MAIQITTTNSFETSSISKYFTPITANVVVGSNIFGDFSASITDMFGGRSGSYEKRLQTIYRQALSNIEKQTKKLGADAVVGLKVDFGEVSGKGMQMFMVCVTGTPVKLKDNNLILPNDPSLGIVEGSIISMKIKAKSIIEINKDLDVHDAVRDHLNIINDSFLSDYLVLISKWLEEIDPNSNYLEKQERSSIVFKYLENIPIDDFKEFIYPYLFKENPKNVKNLVKLVQTRDVIDYEIIKSKLAENKGNQAALHLLYTEKPSYDYSDYINLTDIYHLFDQAYKPLSEQREEESKGLFSKGTIVVWDCKCGKKVQGVRCGSCDRDIFGYNSSVPSPPNVKQNIKNTIEVLEDVLNIKASVL
ncbi:YbjQ family protein [Sphingobacterium lactis]|uniref:YbjQ family protein n=1 Tax=Sphingobacterium lactis TaxID=797291 RepID=UPI003F7E59C0